MKRGFYAKTQSDEHRCPNVEINVLVGIEDVTARIHAAATPEMDQAQAGQAQRAAMSAAEQACSATGGLRCDAVPDRRVGDRPVQKVQFLLHGHSPVIEA
jgi:hypothetical protein